MHVRIERTLANIDRIGALANLLSRDDGGFMASLIGAFIDVRNVHTHRLVHENRNQWFPRCWRNLFDPSWIESYEQWSDYAQSEQDRQKRATEVAERMVAAKPVCRQCGGADKDQ